MNITSESPYSMNDIMIELGKFLTWTICQVVVIVLSALPVRHWRVNTGGRACARCLTRAWEPKQKSLTSGEMPRGV